MDGVTVRSWRAIRRGSLIGVVSVDLACGLQIADIGIMNGADGPWVRLPSRPRVRDGVQLRSERGELMWDAPIVWRSRQLGNEFGVTVLAQVRAKYPDALDPPAPATADAPV